MLGAIGREVFQSEREEPPGRAKPRAVLRMGGAGVLLLQVDEGASELDEALEKK